MLLSSAEYFYFLVLVFFAYWLVRRVRLAGIAVICLANYFFYAKWGLVYLALVPVASTCDFLIGRWLGRTERQAVRRLLISASLGINIGLIVTCKYVPFLVGTWAHWAAPAAITAGWVLPLGLSFYAFQSLTYTVDLYRRDTKPTSNYFAYLASAGFTSLRRWPGLSRAWLHYTQWVKAGAVTSEEGAGVYS